MIVVHLDLRFITTEHRANDIAADLRRAGLALIAEHAHTDPDDVWNRVRVTIEDKP